MAALSGRLGRTRRRLLQANQFLLLSNLLRPGIITQDSSSGPGINLNFKLRLEAVTQLLHKPQVENTQPVVFQRRPA
jgi:hypothetical protein